MKLADIIVTSLLSDAIDCSDGILTLRGSVQQAANGDRIGFLDGMSGTLTLTQGQIVIDKDLNIYGDTDGDLKANVTISGGNFTRIFASRAAPTFPPPPM